MAPRKRIYPIVKRVLDFLGATLLLIVSSPVLLLTAVLVRINLGSPVIFSQPRPGLNEQVFNLYKFRSMKNVDLEQGLLTDEQRLTRFGKTLRSTSLDELPSLLNVLKGEMSFVGPRPLLVEYLPLYSNEQRKRHSIKPGITGLAQANGRNRIEWEEKFILDIKYVNTLSFTTDVKILFQTLINIIQRKDITSPGSKSSIKFQNNG